MRHLKRWAIVALLTVAGVGAIAAPSQAYLHQDNAWADCLSIGWATGDATVFGALGVHPQYYGYAPTSWISIPPWAAAPHRISDSRILVSVGYGSPYNGSDDWGLNVRCDMVGSDTSASAQSIGIEAEGVYN